jgi:hypothetical protein
METFFTSNYKEYKIPIDLDESDIEDIILLEKNRILVLT